MTVRKRTRATIARCAIWVAGSLVLPLLSAQACAQISLSSAVDLALHNDPRIKMAQADVDKARAALAESRDVFIPSMGVSGGYGSSTGVPLGVPVVFQISSQSLLFNFSQKDNVRAAEFGLRSAQLALQESHDQLAEDVVTTYLNLDHAERHQAAVSQEYEFAARLVTIVQQRLDAGQDTRTDLLKAKRTAAQIHLLKLHADDDVATLSDHLSRVVGLPGTSLTAVSSSIPELPAVDTMPIDAGDSSGIKSAFDNARSKQELAFGAARYKYRPQVSFGANYSRISTAHTSYSTYYPAFAGNKFSDNALEVGIQIQIPLFDRAHQDRARTAAADAAHSLYEAENQKNQFLEGRFKLRRSTAELADRIEIATDDQEIAQEQLNAVLVQLTADSGNNGQPQMTPKDEQSARLQERARYVDLLDAQFELQQAQVNLMRQSGVLDEWLKLAVHLPDAQHPASLQPAP